MGLEKKRLMDKRKLKNELSWIREHYSEGENNILAKRFKNEVNPNRNLQSIRARIYAYAKKENLKKN